MPFTGCLCIKLREKENSHEHEYHGQQQTISNCKTLAHFIPLSNTQNHSMHIPHRK